jgi:two-component system, sensor histidine kinase LadS
VRGSSSDVVRRCLPWIWRAALLVLLAVAGLRSGHADHGAPGAERHAGGHYWLDTTGQASLEAARAAFDAGQGRPDDPQRVMPLAGGAAVWYRLQMPPVTTPWRAVLAVPFAGMDHVELFRPQGAGGWSAELSGDAVPVNEWPIQYLHPVFAFTVQPQEAQPSYLRIRHSQDIRVRWMLWDVGTFSHTSKLWHLALGAYAGFMLLVVLLSVLHTFSWRDPIHLYYAVHVVLMGTTVLALTGLAGEYLWPHLSWWNDKAPLVMPAVSLAWMNIFVRELVAERGRAAVSWLLWAHTAYCAAMAVLMLVVRREDLFSVPSVLTVPSAILILCVLAWYAWRRPQVGLWVLAGWLVLAVGVVLPMLRNLGVLAPSFATQHALLIGGALEIPLVLAGIYLRSRERRDQLVRLAALARTDPLTGLASHRVLLNRLDDLLRRGGRDPALGAVLRLRVANLETIRAEHGREAAEAALLQAAECVTREAGQGDTVAREQSGDLVLVLEGRVSRDHVAEAARNIIARGLKFSSRLPPQVTVAFRVAAACAPLPPLHPVALLDRLDDTLDTMGRDPRGRALRIINDPGPGPGARVDTPPIAPQSP